MSYATLSDQGNLRRLSLPLLAVVLAGNLLACQLQNQEATLHDSENGSRPNILLLVADDLAYSDLGSYGSEIHTPHLDRLAAEGIRFIRFHTAPICAPTRAMLLSGNDNKVAGMGAQSVQSEQWGYEGHLTDRIVTIPHLLGQAGYDTFMTGKWHLGGKVGELPPSKGFDRSFVLHQGAANHYNNTFLFSSDSTADYSVNGTPVDWPEGAYSTKVYTDSLIQYIKENRESQRPFFAYAAYTSPHWPLQVGESFWRTYEGRYDEGYEAFRKQRLSSLEEARMIPRDAGLPPLHPAVEPWEELRPTEQKREARKMALYAGMVEHLDHHIGRLIRLLKEIGQYENTVIVFMSDNGPAGEDFYNHPQTDFLRSRYDNRYDNMGSPSSFVSYGPPWAEAGSAPFRNHKGSTYEGGVVAPLIIRAPGIENRGSIYDEFTVLTDLAPTLYEIAGVSYPTSFEGHPIYPLPGISLLPILQGDTTQIHSDNDAWVMERSGRVLERQGDWKLVNPGEEWTLAHFELYNVASDPGETRDLKDQRPRTFEELLAAWKDYRERYQVKPPGQ